MTDFGSSNSPSASAKQRVREEDNGQVASNTPEDLVETVNQADGIIHDAASKMEEFSSQLSSKESQDLEDEASYAVSFLKTCDYGHDDGDGETAASSEVKPTILLMGPKRSGKKSIIQKVSPDKTLCLKSTNKIVKEDVTNSSFIRFQIWDLPGQLDCFDSVFDAEKIFGSYGALIFVIDVQDDYIDALQKLHVTVTKVYKINPNIKFEVFIHKVDGLSDDHKIETQKEIYQRACDDLIRAGLKSVHLSFYFTSIYDHSVLEAVSRVVQKLNPQLPTLENLLNILTSNSRIQKAFLFNVVSKIYIATDSSPVDMQSYEMCCDMIDVVIDVSCIYGGQDDSIFDTQSASVIKLNNGTVLYLRKVNTYLALVCILGVGSFERQGLIEYNISHFQQAIQEVFELWAQSKLPDMTRNSMTKNDIQVNDLSTKQNYIPEDPDTKQTSLHNLTID